MPTHDDDEEALKEQVRDAHERFSTSKKRAHRLTEALVEGNQRQREFLDSIKQANDALGGVNGAN